MAKKLKHQQERILAAAQKRFAQYGYSKVTMDEIAGDIEMGKASLYYYYPTKGMLFQAVIEIEKEGFIREVEHLIAKDIPASQKLISYTELRCKYLEKFVNLGTQQFHADTASHSTNKNYFKRFKMQELSLIEKIIREGIAKKEFKKDPDENLPRIIFNFQQVFSFFLLKKSHAEKENKSVLRNMQNDLIILMKLILTGMKH